MPTTTDYSLSDEAFQRKMAEITASRQSTLEAEVRAGLEAEHQAAEDIERMRLATAERERKAQEQRDAAIVRQQKRYHLYLRLDGIYCHEAAVLSALADLTDESELHPDPDVNWGAISLAKNNIPCRDNRVYQYLGITGRVKPDLALGTPILANLENQP